MTNNADLNGATASKPRPRLASLDEIITTVLPAYISPIPKRRTVKAWLDGAGVSRFKLNPGAVRGGGVVFYSIAAVEKLFLTRTSPPR